jgi:hypothetical protein
VDQNLFYFIQRFRVRIGDMFQIAHGELKVSGTFFG